MDPKPLLKMIEDGRDAAPLRFALATHYFKAGDFAVAITHAERALKLQSDYSAAWSLCGRAWEAAGRPDNALAAYNRGLKTAQKQGDKQTEKALAVFIRRLEKTQSDLAQSDLE